jgi:hypothetical protein
MTVRGHVTNGRLVVDVPTDLPEGSEVELVTVGDIVEESSPHESPDDVARAWSEEVERRAARVRAGESNGKPSDQVFDRIEAKLRAR